MSQRIRIVNCYYCKGTGRALDPQTGRAPFGGAKDPCGTCDGEGRLRLSPEGEILGPQPMSPDECTFDSFKAALARGDLAAYRAASSQKQRAIAAAVAAGDAEALARARAVNLAHLLPNR